MLARDLAHHHVHGAVALWRQFSPHTKATYAKALRRFIRWLEQIAGTQPTLSAQVTRFRQPPPRAVVATDQERDLLLSAAPPALRFFLLLCADLGLRHRTATSICIANFDPLTQALTFLTKGGVQQTLPASPALLATLTSFPAGTDPHVPIVNLLRPGRHHGSRPRLTKQWKALKRRCGVREELRVHDLRRTLAEDAWHASHDLRQVQALLGHTSPHATARYLANRLGLQELTPLLEHVRQLRDRRQQPQPPPPPKDGYDS